MSLEFIFPLKRECLLDEPSDNRLYIQERIMIDIDNPDEEFSQYLEEIMNQLESDPTSITKTKEFTYLYALFDAYERTRPKLKGQLTKGFTNILQKYVKILDNSLIQNNDSKESTIMRNALKIYIFYIDWLVDNIIIYCK